MTGKGPSPLAGYQIVVGSGRSLPRLSFNDRTATANVRAGALRAGGDGVVAPEPAGGVAALVGVAAGAGVGGEALVPCRPDEHEVSAPARTTAAINSAAARRLTRPLCPG